MHPCRHASSYAKLGTADRQYWILAETDNCTFSLKRALSGLSLMYTVTTRPRGTQAATKMDSLLPSPTQNQSDTSLKSTKLQCSGLIQKFKNTSGWAPVQILIKILGNSKVSCSKQQESFYLQNQMHTQYTERPPTPTIPIGYR